MQESIHYGLMWKEKRKEERMRVIEREIDRPKRDIVREGERKR